MINIKEEAFVSFLLKAKEKAIATNEKQLISFTKEIKNINLLDIYAAYESSDLDKFYWSNHTGDFELVGIGKLINITRYDDDLAESEKEWQAIIKAAHTYNPYGLSGTGIVAMGGVAFDILQDKSDLWSNFPNSKLSIPECLVTRVAGRFFLTVNQFIDASIVLRDVMDDIHRLEFDILDLPMAQISSHQIKQQTEIEPEAWKELVREAVAQIEANKAKKIVLARELRLKLNRQASIHILLRKLTATQANSYIFAYEEGDDCFIGATPERLVQIEGDKLLSTCLAGTTPRGKTLEADQALANDLLHDDKNLEEHAYVVQMIHDNIKDFCDAIKIPEAPVIYPLRNLQHLYTPVEAKLKDNASVLQIIKQLHPTPALGGVPREKALMFIREHEFLERGWYGAPIGWMDSNQNSEFAVAIRSGLIQEDEVSLFAGCGIMKDSDAEMEYEETKVKFLPMLNVLED